MDKGATAVGLVWYDDWTAGKGFSSKKETGKRLKIFLIIFVSLLIILYLLRDIATTDLLGLFVIILAMASFVCLIFLCVYLVHYFSKPKPRILPHWVKVFKNGIGYKDLKIPWSQIEKISYQKGFTSFYWALVALGNTFGTLCTFFKVRYRGKTKTFGIRDVVGFQSALKKLKKEHLLTKKFS